MPVRIGPLIVAALLLWSLGSCVLTLQRRPGVAPHSRVLQGSKEPSFTRLKRKNLAVDFVIPAAFRNSLRDLLGLFPAGAGATNFQASSSLSLDCWPLVRSFSKHGRDHQDLKNDQQTPRHQPALLSKVLKSGFLKSLRRSKQLLLEVGEDMVREGCGISWGPLVLGGSNNDSSEGQGNLIPNPAMKRKLEFNLTELMSWWLKSKEGRLRIRLMPQRSAFYPGREENLSVALRASQPRLTFHILRKGFNFAKYSSSNPLNIYTWNISWVMKEAFTINSPRAKHEFDCNFESPCDLEYLPPMHKTEKTWRISSAEELLRANIQNGPRQDYSENSSSEHFLNRVELSAHSTNGGEVILLPRPDVEVLQEAKAKKNEDVINKKGSCGDTGSFSGEFLPRPLPSKCQTCVGWLIRAATGYDNVTVYPSHEH
ncbi:ALK tyrosine kinase receptor-like [Spea bombifrons]|uniref:ALK tyrosine kinase receptor-like n=1 Tax=Spea bombifrons TaxID=233779 RepID=UPI00234A1F91|nr:ALK tyrosine kinase receptor-like [Spea bombifrons]